MVFLKKNQGRAIIVGSGPSANGFIPPDDVVVISVNGSIDWLTRVDYWFSLDLSQANIARLRQHKSEVKYYISQDQALCAWLSHKYPFATIIARRAWRGKEPVAKYSPEWWLWRWSGVKRLATSPKEIHSGNSAWGALGLAYHLGFTNVALVGVDATTEERIEGGGCNNLSHLPLLFASALPQINVVSCGQLTGIPQLSFKEWYNNTDENNFIVTEY